jgi:serine/threonine protein kinase
MNESPTSNSQKSEVQLPPTTIIGGRFQIEAFLQSESGTDIYQAVDTRSGKPVALRLFVCPPSLRPMLEADLGYAASVQHQNIAAMVAWGYDGERAYVATEPLEGASLGQIINAKRNQGGVVGLSHAIVLIGHAVNALEVAYPTIAHGGLNPSTIRLNNAGRVRVMNLGLSRTLFALSHPLPSAGSPYLAPELAAGAAPSPAADVFSLSAIFYELVTGHVSGSPPWPASQVNPDLPKKIDGIFDRGLASLPEARYSRPAQLLADLTALNANGPQHRPTPLGLPVKNSLGKSFSVADAVKLSEEYECWLVQKNNLDYGPFSLSQVIKQIENGTFSCTDFIVDSDSGNRQQIKDHPQLAEFARLNERRLEAQRRSRAEQAHQHVNRRKRRWMFLISGIAVIAMVATVTVYLLNRKAAQNEALAMRMTEEDIDNLLKNVKVEFAKPKRATSGRRSVSGGGNTARRQDFNNNMVLGDVSKEGGDSLLDDGLIDNIMRANYRKLVPCVFRAGVRKLDIDFVLAPTGKVQAVTVNGQRRGGLSNCIYNQMQSFGFPSYNGVKTIASWSMSLR